MFNLGPFKLLCGCLKKKNQNTNLSYQNVWILLISSATHLSPTSSCSFQQKKNSLHCFN